MKTKHFCKRAALLIILSISIIGINSCKKNPEKIGNSLQPQSSYIQVSFTGDQQIEAATQRIDSLATSSATYMLLGNMYDPVFGRSNLSFYTQLAMSTSSYEWGDNPKVDSIVLQLYYYGYYGDTLQSQNVRVFEVIEDFKTDSTYYSSDELECGREYANHTFSPRPHTFNNIDDDTLSAGVLRIPIDTLLGNHFFHDGEVNFESNENFINYFRGFYVACDNESNGTGSISYFNLVNSKTYMRVYYHNDTDTLTYDFTVGKSEPRFNHFHHNYNSAIRPIVFNDTTDNRYLFVQGTSGTRVWLKFSQLAQWAAEQNTNILINEAKLTLTGAPNEVDGAENDTSIFLPTTQLVIAKANADGTFSLLPDYYEGSAYYGGTYDAKTNQIWFRISEYIQDLVLQGPNAQDYGLYIYVNAGSYNARRWIFNGPDYQDPATAIKLDIIYSKIDD